MARSVRLISICSNTGIKAACMCRFLRMCPGLSRQIIGDLLGENNERCLRVLECFTASFDFTGLPPKFKLPPPPTHLGLLASGKSDPTDPALPASKFSGLCSQIESSPTLEAESQSCRPICICAGLPFEAALREYLESFRLPGESQKIYRILESWSRQFHRQCPGIFRTSDAVLVLAFSLVLLNTDRHKSTVSPMPAPHRPTSIHTDPSSPRHSF